MTINNLFLNLLAQIKMICTLYRVLCSPVMLLMVVKEKVVVMESSLFFSSCGQCSFSLILSPLFNNQWNVNEKLDVGPSLPKGWYFESRQGHRPLSLLYMAMERFRAFFLHKVMDQTGSSSHYICFLAERASSLFLSKNWWNIKQLLDEVLITETLIIPVLQKPNLIIVLLYIVYKKITTNRPSHGTQFEMHYARNLQIIH